MADVADSTNEPQKRGLRTWLKRAGFAGLAFFTLKGLLWLAIPAAVFFWDGCASAG